MSAYDAVPFGVIDPDYPDGRFKIITRSELRARPRPAWIIDGILQGSGVVVLAGEPGLGKSFLCLDWAAHVATGRAWCGRKVRPGRVLYVAGEGIEFFPDRVDAWEVHNRAFVDDERLLFVEEGFSLSDPAAVGHMRRAVTEHEFDLVILDTLSQLSALESENDNAALAGVLNTARAIRQARPGTTVLIVHHVNKGERGRVRGASSIRGNADQIIVAKRHAGGFLLSTETSDDGKSKNAKAWTLAGFGLRDVAPSAVVVHDEPEDKDRDAIMRVLAGGDWHAIGEIHSERGDVSEAASKRLRRRLEALIEAGEVIENHRQGRAKRWGLPGTPGHEELDL